MKPSDKELTTINACRYCPMCRQSCPSEFINYKESDTPRGRAILLHNVYNGGKEFEASAIESIYNCFLCGACKSWCAGYDIGGYDIPELVKFARKDIVSKGLAPQVVQEISKSLVENDNTANRDRKLSYTNKISEKTAEILYILGEGVNYNNHEIADAFIHVLKHVRVSYTLLKDEPTSGKELELLGYTQKAKEKAKLLFERIKSTGCKKVVVADPLVYDALKNDFVQWGLGLDIDILHTSEYLLELIKSGKTSLKQSKGKVTLADSEFLGRYNNVYEAPREIIKASGNNRFIEMQWHHEYLQSAGEAAFTFDGNPFNRGKDLGQKISLKAEAIQADVIVTLSATAKNNISEITDLKVLDVAEFVKEYLI